MSFPLKELAKKTGMSSKIDEKGNNDLYPVIFDRIFSPDFFDKIKSEMGQKVKPSKSVLEALKHSNKLVQMLKVKLIPFRNRLFS